MTTVKIIPMKKLMAIILAFISLATFGQQHYPIRNMLGSNIHEWDMMTTDDDFNNPQQKTDALQKAIVDCGLTGVRIYVDVGPAKSEDNQLYHLSPNRRGWRIDSGLLMLKAKIPGFAVLYCYQGAPDNIQADYNAAGERNSLYIRRGADRLNPLSWAEEGRDAFVLASRGGTNKNVPDYPVFTPDNTWETRQTMYKGAGFITILSPTNEPDNQWTTIPMNGYGMAAMSATFYDSAKKADPNIIVGSPGVASDDTVYLSQMLDWKAKNNRTKPLFNEYEFHSYGSGMWTWDNNTASGIPPEISTIKNAKKTVKYVWEKFGVPSNVGEHSYDQHEYSWLGIRPISNYTPSQRVAYWGVREILGYSVAGIKRAFYYKLYQDWNTAADSSEGLFATSSLMVQNPDGRIVRRLIGDVYKQLNEVGDFVYDRTIIDNDTVKLYVFKSGAQELWTGWTVEQISTTWDRGVRAVFTERFYPYSLNISGTRLDINEDSSGVFKHTPFYPSTVTLSSKPFFILVNTAQSPLPVKLISFTAQKQNNTVLLQWNIEGSDHVEIERSDASAWLKIGSTKYSQCVDATPAQGYNFYRLKIFEADGKFSYSPVRLIAFNKLHVRVKVIDAIGRTVISQNTNDIDQFKEQLQHSGRLTSGIYLIQMEGYQYNEKILKQ